MDREKSDVEERESDDMEERLAIAQSKLDAMRAAKSEAAERIELVQKLERAEREIRNLEALEKLELEHGLCDLKIRRVDVPDGRMVIVRRANHLVMRKFADQAEDAKTESVLKLVRPYVLHPSLVEFDSLIEDYPAVLYQCGNAISWLAGFTSKDLAAKSKS